MLSDVLSNLNSKRSDLRQAICAKGVVVPESATIADCVSAIGNIQGEGFVLDRVDFFVCIEVTPTRWYGRKLEKSGGEWGFSTFITETGLTYSTNKPHVGHVYNSDVSIEIGYIHRDYPRSGLIVDYPLDWEKSSDLCGNTLSHYGTSYSFTTEAGVSCIAFADKTSNLEGTLAIPVSSSCFSFSLWWKQTQGNSNSTPFHFGDFYLGEFGGDTIEFDRNGMSVAIDQGYPSVWTHYVITYDQSTLVFRFYKNGEFQRAIINSYNVTMPISKYVLGYRQSGEGYLYLSRFRVYNRILNQFEVNDLYSELSPTDRS